MAWEDYPDLDLAFNVGELFIRLCGTLELPMGMALGDPMLLTLKFRGSPGATYQFAGLG